MFKVEKLRIVEELKKYDPASKEYAALVAQLQRLHEMDNTSFSLNNSAVIAAIANLVGIVLIINHERASVITSKAFQLLKRV
jgi:hypothetical protein